MSRWIWALAVGVALCVIAPWSTSVQASQSLRRLRVAITVDDLPGVVPPGSTVDHQQVVTALVSTLRGHGVRHATGFLNGEGIERDPAQRAAMDTWVEGGFEVGNHTYTHPALSETDISHYLRDIDQNQPIVDRLSKRLGQRSRYFRAPYLDEGSNEVERAALRRHLRAQRMLMARVSVDFDDWAFSLPHARCSARNDADAVALLQAAYVEHAIAHLRWAETASRQLLGRNMPHVLLLHANPVTATSLAALLHAFDGLGVEYISLTEALRDPIYSGNYATSGTHVIVQAANQRGVSHAPVPVLPLPLLQLACR